MTRNTIHFFLNGKEIHASAYEASMMLSDYLRLNRNLTGTKVVCAEGDCGACSVLKYNPTDVNNKDHHFLPINSCITLVASLDGSHILTVEALKNKDSFHPAQDSMIKCHGSQCGFCTPGFVITMAGLCEEKARQQKTCITKDDAKNALTGNLCRCTGYESIIDSAMMMKLENYTSLFERYHSKDIDEKLKMASGEAISIQTDEFSYDAPSTLKNAQEIISKNPDYRILGSGTDLGVVHNKRKIKLQKLLNLHKIKELYQISKNQNTITLGSRVTLTEFRHFLKNHQSEITNYIDIFASPQIKNQATVVGNIANASPIGDMAPVFLTLNGKVLVSSPLGNRSIDFDNFYLGYRKTSLNPQEIIVGLSFELPSIESDFKIFKNSNRKDLDISAVNFSIHCIWEDKTKSRIKQIYLAAGGIAATPLRLKQTEDFLISNLFSPTHLENALKIMQNEFTPLTDLRATSEYRRLLMNNYLTRFFQQAKRQAHELIP